MSRQTGQVDPTVAQLSNRFSDWRLESYDGWVLRLVADNDLTYHHAVEVLFEGVTYISLPSEFSHPVFRDPTAAETEVIRSALYGDLDGVTIYAWDIDAELPGRSCLLAAHTVTVTEEMKAHY